MSLKRVLSRPCRPALPSILAALLLTGAAAAAQTVRLPAFRNDGKSHIHVQGMAKTTVTCGLPTITCFGGSDDSINQFFNTTGNYSYLDQVKSIYNGAANAATVSADLATLNFHIGTQVTLGTNIQAGASQPATVSTGAVPTLSSASAAQATQNMLYGGTVVASMLLPVYFLQTGNSKSAGGFGMLFDIVGREGLDIQNFTAGTSTTAASPPSHTNVQLEGYAQFNSINTLASGDIAGAFFIGGSYGYAYTSHAYARDYGFWNKVNSNVGQLSLGFLLSGVARIAVSRGFGPSQIYNDSTSMARQKVNNFKGLSFGITYQSPPPAPPAS